MNEEKIKTVFGDTLLKRRKSEGLTQQQVGHECGRTTRYYQYLEKGEYNPSLITIFRLCDALDTSPDKLVAESWKAWKKLKK